MAKQENVFVDMDSRYILLSDDIEEATISKVSFALLGILKTDSEKENNVKNYERKPIKIFINSFGGEVYDMLGLIDIMLNSKTPIYTYCTGKAVSAGALIFLAGSKRFISKHATIMLHQMNCLRHGKYMDLVEDREEMDWLNKTTFDYILERTNIKEDFLTKAWNKKQDLYYHKDKALKYNLATDEVEENEL